MMQPLKHDIKTALPTLWKYYRCCLFVYFAREARLKNKTAANKDKLHVCSRRRHNVTSEHDHIVNLPDSTMVGAHSRHKSQQEIMNCARDLVYQESMQQSHCKY